MWLGHNRFTRNVKTEENQKMVTIISGANQATVDVAGRTVSQILEQYRSAFNIPAGAKATVDGRPAAGTDVVKSGARLVFAAATAEKGL